MLELVLCSLFTIVPDYLYRRYVQGKRIGHEITLYSVWFELRWGLTACLMLTVLLITIIFYHHPSTTSVTAFFRTIPILPESSGRVSEIYVKVSDDVAKGAPILRLDSSKREADLELAKRRVVEVDASMVMAQADIAAADGQIQQAKGAYEQALDELQYQDGAQAAQYRRRSTARDRAASEFGRGAEGRRCGGGSCQASGRDAHFHPPSRPKGKRRSGAPSSAGRSGQDGCLCRRDRPGGAVHSSGRRHRQSVHATWRCPDPNRKPDDMRSRPASGSLKRR